MLAKLDGYYDEKIGFMSPKVLKEALQNYADEEGVKPAVIARKALVKYLKEKGVLKDKVRYL